MISAIVSWPDYSIEILGFVNAENLAAQVQQGSYRPAPYTRDRRGTHLSV